MLVFRIVAVCALCVVVAYICPEPAFARVIFEDDFEADEINAQPSKWKVIDQGGKWPGKVVVDPEDANNKALVPSINGYRGGTVYVAGNPDMQNFIVEFDWRYRNPGGEYTVAFRYQDVDNCYTFGKLDGTNMTCRKRLNGQFSELARVARSAELEGDVWYRFQITVQGVQFTVKVKEKKDNTPFLDMEPFLVATDGVVDEDGNVIPGEDVFTKGYFALYGSMALNSGWHDNVQITTLPGEAVDPMGKLAITWASIKRSQ